MLISETCNELLVGDLKHLWSFMKSDDGQMAFLSLATIRALFYYLLRNPLPEARELGCAALVMCLLGLWVAISQSYPPKWMTQLVAACTQSVADNRRTAISLKHDAHAAHKCEN
jgi:hypothetical protein